VNAIAPALIETDMVTNNLNASPDLIPMGHFGAVDDVASVAVMLATNDYIGADGFSEWWVVYELTAQPEAE
jgi:3-oxoacyl-[acyl-carrier protein] reductase